MTSQTKKYIEMSDIVGIRFECKKCGCSLLLDIGREDGTLENLLGNANTVLSSCPTCASPWTRLPDGRLAFDSEIKDFFRRLRDLKAVESKFGCALSVEIKGEKVVGAQ